MYDYDKIDPGNAFRIVVSIAKYTVVNEYGLVHMEDQEYDVWFDSNKAYTMTGFVDDMATNIIWGNSQ